MSNKERQISFGRGLPDIKPTAKMPPVKPPKPEQKPNSSSSNSSEKD